MCGCRSLNVAVPIADNKAAFCDHGPVLHQIQDHAGLWLSPRMIFKIALDRAARMMRTVADVVDDGAVFREFAAHPVEQGVEFGLGEIAARHA